MRKIEKEKRKHDFLSSRKAIGAILLQKRVDLFESMYQISGACSLEYSQVSAIESGEKGYNINSLLSYLDAIGYTIAFVPKGTEAV